MLIWCTGISGSERTDYLESAAKAINDDLLDPRTAEVFDVGQMLNAVPEHLRHSDNHTDLLDGNEDLLRLHRLSALKELEAQIHTSTADIKIISTHAAFLRGSRLVSGMDMNLLRQFFADKIDLFLTISHDANIIWSNLESRKEWQGQLRLADVVVWRTFESATTRMLAEYLDVKFVELARRADPRAIQGLTKSPAAPSLYLSYPITSILEEDPALLDRASEFAEKLTDIGFVVFDPLSIQDLNSPQTGEFILLENDPPLDQAKEANRYIESQILSRDLQWVDQADMVVVYYPTELVSPGVFAEMSHARDVRRPVYLCEFPGRVSPFLGMFHQAAFATINDTIDGLKKIYSERL